MSATKRSTRIPDAATTALPPTVREAALDAAARMAPWWPLTHFVAVNPMLGLTHLDLAGAAHRLGLTHGARLTLPRAALAEALTQGLVTDADLRATLDEVPDTLSAEATVACLRLHARQPAAAAPAIPRLATVADVASRVTGVDHSALVRDSISRWAADHFDADCAAWASPWRELPPYAAWLERARVDRSLDIAAVPGLRALVGDLPTDVDDLLAHGADRLGLPPASLPLYFHRLLADVAGWAGHLRQRGWADELAGGDANAVLPLLAIRLAHEILLIDALPQPELARRWQQERKDYAHADRAPNGRRARFDLLLQLAFERAAQRALAEQLTPEAPAPAPATRPRIQAVFCIDVRSERLRRALEQAHDDVETLGFAGFFGVALDHQDGDVRRVRGPVLIAPPTPLKSPAPVDGGRARRGLLRSLRTGAVAAFGYVEAFGMLALPSLLRETLAPRPADAPRACTSARLDLPLADRVDLAEGMLRGMSLTHDHAPLLVLVGHGSRSANNPFASGLDCGACGGHAGDVNARVAATLLNDPEVRAGLATRGVVLPEDTHVLAALHETTTDTVTVLDTEDLPPSHRDALADFEAELADAGRRVRIERAPTLGVPDGVSVDRAIARRAADWSQVRPEWGLAGCAGFVVGPRRLTRGIDLGGRCFLHSYDRHEDPEGAVLETILTAPLVVASWISLQYYASTVDNETFGAGDKTLHNVVAGLGVLEGNGGDLRTGLPLQSVDDGRGPVHRAVRLAAFVAAPLETMERIVDAHADLRALLVGGWVRLHRLDDAGRVTHRLDGRGVWAPWPEHAASTTTSGRAA